MKKGNDINMSFLEHTFLRSPRESALVSSIGNCFRTKNDRKKLLRFLEKNQNLFSKVNDILLIDEYDQENDLKDAKKTLLIFYKKLGEVFSIEKVCTIDAQLKLHYDTDVLNTIFKEYEYITELKKTSKAALKVLK